MAMAKGWRRRWRWMERDETESAERREGESGYLGVLQKLVARRYLAKSSLLLRLACSTNKSRYRLPVLIPALPGHQESFLPSWTIFGFVFGCSTRIGTTKERQVFGCRVAAIWRSLYPSGTRAGLASFGLPSTSSVAPTFPKSSPPRSNAIPAFNAATAATQLTATTLRPMALRLSAGRSASALARRRHHPSAATARCFTAAPSRHAVRLAPEPPNMRVRGARPPLLSED